MESSEDDLASGSLFEGMVLFSPSDLSSSSSSSMPPPETGTGTETPSQSLSPPPPPLPATSEQQSQPLDEDLFSDLTLQSPQSQSQSQTPQPPFPPPQTINPPSAPHVTRQTTRKKKRAVRIGYARDSSLHLQDLDQDRDRDRDQNQNQDRDQPRAPQQSPAKEERSPATHDPDAHDLSPQERTTVTLTPTEDEILPPVLEEQPSSTSLPRSNEGDGKDEHIESRLVIIRERILENIEGIRRKAGLLSAKRKELGRRRRRAMERANLAGEEHMKLERELEEAVEAEDFERAERVSESVAEKEKEKGLLVGELRKMEVECDALDSEMGDVLVCLIAAEEEKASLLEEFGKVFYASTLT